MFYIEKPIPLKRDETIFGSIALRKNDIEETDVDIKISYHYTGSKYQYDNICYYRLR